MTMRRALAVAIIALVVVALLPVAAFAAPGGNGHESGPAFGVQEKQNGKGHKASGVESSMTAGVRVPPGQARKHRDANATASVEGTSSPKVTGIENALARLQRNLARMQARIDAGQRAELPAGVVSVISRFLAWLGVPQESVAVDPAAGAADTVEPTGTVEPDEVAEPAEVETDTVEAPDAQ